MIKREHFAITDAYADAGVGQLFLFIRTNNDVFRWVCANSADPDQTAPMWSTMFAITFAPFRSFRRISGLYIPFGQLR